MVPELFWRTLRQDVFKGKLTQGVVDTVNVIVNTYYDEYFLVGNPHHLAYILATAYHESYSPSKNPDWLPIREGFAKTNQGAINAVTKLYEKGAISVNYALPKANGLSYYGRGFAQVTHDRNYIKVGDRLGVDLYNYPDKLLERGLSAKALVIGSYEGLYTGKKLTDYDLPGGKFDAVGARRIINGKDKAEKIAGDFLSINNAIFKAITARDDN